MVEWKEVLDEFTGRWDKCFGCGRNNPIGLKLDFKWDGKSARAEWTPREEFQGWPGILHGGIIANILDEAASWAFAFNGMFVITAKIEVFFRNPTRVGEPIIITSNATIKNGKRGEALSRITTKDGTLIAESTSLHVNIKDSNIGFPPSLHNFAVIWDMDGVIVDTAQYHLKAWHYAFRKHGTDFLDADFVGKFGQRNDAIIRSTMNREITQAELEEIATEKEEYFRRIVRDSIKPLPGAVDLIRSLAKEGVKMAIATSAPSENVELLLGSIGIRDCFRQFVYGREVSESKPSPLIYLLAANKLGTDPKDCIVIEDAMTGVTGARRAGMHCVAITTTLPREKLQEADLVVDSLASLSVSSLEQLIAEN